MKYVGVVRASDLNNVIREFCTGILRAVPLLYTVCAASKLLSYYRYSAKQIL